jgi:hypothetical protein
MPLKPVYQNENERIEDSFQFLLEQGMSVFTLRMKRFSEEKMLVLGFEILEVSAVPNLNTGGMNFVTNPVRDRHTTFFPDKYRVPIAKVADTPYNRRKLATSFWNGQWEITSLVTPNGTVTGPVIREQIETQARELGIKPPTVADEMDLEREARTGEEKRLMTAEEIVNDVEKKYAELVSYLKEKFGEAYKKSEEYKRVIGPARTKALEAYGYTKEVLEKLRAEKKIAAATPKLEVAVDAEPAGIESALVS